MGPLAPCALAGRARTPSVSDRQDGSVSKAIEALEDRRKRLHRTLVAAPGAVVVGVVEQNHVSGSDLACGAGGDPIGRR